VTDFAWSEATVCRALARQTFKDCLCAVDNATWPGHECDLLVVTPNLRVVEVEAKISRADLRADAKKEKWWQRAHAWREPKPDPVPLSHPRNVWKHYYAMPATIWRDDMLDFMPASSGVLLLTARPWSDHVSVAVKCARRSKPSRDAKPLPAESVAAIARLASLRMWDAYERERIARGDPHVFV
jgi:hypothetical protein